MKIIDRVEQLKKMAFEYGNYRLVAEKSGLSFHWLQKFAIGSIENPNVKNVAKLEAFFFEASDDRDAA
jgi:hypothetical protein